LNTKRMSLVTSAVHVLLSRPSVCQSVCLSVTLLYVPWAYVLG